MTGNKWRDAKGRYHDPRYMTDQYLDACINSCRMRNWKKWLEIFEDEKKSRIADELNAGFDRELAEKIRAD